MRKLWAGDYAHEGRYWRFPLSTSVPKPKQQPEPPIWIAARDPGTYDWAIANGAHILSTPLSAPPAEMLSLGEKFRKAVADHPEVPRPRFMMQRRTCVYAKQDDWEAPSATAASTAAGSRTCSRTSAAVNNGFPEAIDRRDLSSASANYDPENMRRNLLFGTPDEIIEKLDVYQAGRRRRSLDQHQLRPAVRDAEDHAVAVHRRGHAGLRGTRASGRAPHEKPRRQRHSLLPRLRGRSASAASREGVHHAQVVT